MHTGTEWEKVRQDVADYEFKLKISEGVCENYEFFILILNFEFWLRIRFWISKFNFNLDFRF